MLKINWMYGYANSPDILIEEDLAVSPREDLVFLHKNGVWVSVQDNGVVQYFAHNGSDKNNGGYGGAIFTITDEEGNKRNLAGPWSSRASVVNMNFENEIGPITEVSILGRDGYVRRVGMLVSEVEKRMREQEDTKNLHLVREIRGGEREKSTYYVSTSNTDLVKPDGSRFSWTEADEIQLEEFNAN